MCNTRN